jgi:hypothetical protein
LTITSFDVDHDPRKASYVVRELLIPATMTMTEFYSMKCFTSIEVSNPRVCLREENAARRRSTALTEVAAPFENKVVKIHKQLEAAIKGSRDKRYSIIDPNLTKELGKEGGIDKDQ